MYLVRSLTLHGLVVGLAALIFSACLGTGAMADVHKKERVLGIGGFFFRSENPAKLSQWYELHLGVTVPPKSYIETPWLQDAGPTIFTGFPKSTDYFSKKKQWMISFRVQNLDALVKQLRAASIKVIVDPKTYPNGLFARLEDPEGNPIQLWQPNK